MEDTFVKVCALVQEICGEQTMARDTSLDDLGFDDVDRVDLIISLEQDFDIAISDEEEADLKRIEDIVTLVDRKTKPDGN